MSALVAVDVGGTTIKGALFAPDGAVLERSVHPTGHGDAAAAAVARCAALLTTSAARLDLAVAATGVVTPGIVDGERGVVAYAANLGWRDLALRDRVADATGTEVALGPARPAAREGRGGRGAGGDGPD